MTETHKPPRCCSELTPREGIDLHEVETDPAMESLSNALQMTFRLLSALMFVFILLFLSTGIARIKPQEQGVCKRFGKVVGIVDQGLAFNWPYPIGEIQIVRTDEQRIEVNDFWMHETESDRKTPLAKRRRGNRALRPGFDGYLFTGDRNIIHLRFQVGYKVVDPLAYLSKMIDAKEMVRLAVRQATIETAATRTAYGILTKVEEFRSATRERAQAILTKETSRPNSKLPAIQINSLLIPSEGITWPLAAYSAYEAAVAASAKKREMIKMAIGNANKRAEIIGNLAFVQLAGEPWETQQDIARRTKLSADYLHAVATTEGRVSMPAELASWNGQYNLLGQYLQLQGDNAAAKNTHRLSALYQQIVDLVRSDAAGGTVRQIIAQAESDKSKTVEDAKARADRFERLYAQFKANPETQNIFIERMWLNELDEILSSPIISKHIYPGGSTEPIILELNPDPNVEREIRNERRRRATDNTVREVAPDQEGM